MNEDQIKKLAELARVEISAMEVEDLKGDMEAILGYVDQITTVADTQEQVVNSENRNIMREDTDAHEKGVHTDTLLAEAPKKKDGYVEVKKILP